MRLLVENLPQEVSEHELYCLFMEFGCITNVSICRGLDGRSLGLAHIEMKTIQNGHAAIKILDTINFMNRFLRVYEIQNGF